MSKKPTLDIVFDHGILESFLYNTSEGESFEYITELPDDVIEDIETKYWERNPITFAKWLPNMLNYQGSVFSVKKMFNCLDIYIKSGDIKYNYRFRENKII